MKPWKVLIVDDDELFLGMVSRKLDRVMVEDGLHELSSVVTATSGTAAIAELHTDDGVDLMITDILMPDMDGRSLLVEAKRRKPDTVVIMMTAYGKIKDAVVALRDGAFDYVTKPFEIDELMHKVRMARKDAARTAEMDALLAQSRVPVAPPARGGPADVAAAGLATAGPSAPERRPFPGFCGVSPRRRQAVDLLCTAAHATAPLIIVGDPGSGRRFSARSVHLLSTDMAISGYREFDGTLSSSRDRDVRLTDVLNDTGLKTLCIHEIGEVDPLTLDRIVGRLRDARNAWQPRLVATAQPGSLNVTNPGMYADVFAQGYSWVALPSLRSTPEDIEPFAAFLFDTEFSDRRIRSIAPAAMQRLLAHHWSGNIGEFVGVMREAYRSACADPEADDIRPEHLPVFVSARRSPTRTEPVQGQKEWRTAIDDALARPGLDAKVEGIERLFINDALTKAVNNKVKAAQLLKISRRNLYYRLKKYHMLERE